MNASSGESGSTPELLIQSHIDAHVPWGVLNFGGGSRGLELVVLKGQPKSVIQLIAQATLARANSPFEVLDPALGNALGYLGELVTKFGRELPMFEIGVRSTLVSAIYQSETIHLDYADPNFFERLDRVLARICSHDNFGGICGSLQIPPLIGRCS